MEWARRICWSMTTGTMSGVVVVEDLAAGTDMLVRRHRRRQRFPAAHQTGHAHRPQDRAASDLAAGDTVIKYGEDIGKIVAPVAKGAHVHTHNLKTKRW